jgi:hypothetical protein
MSGGRSEVVLARCEVGRFGLARSRWRLCGVGFAVVEDGELSDRGVDVLSLAVIVVALAS